MRAKSQELNFASKITQNMGFSTPKFFMFGSKLSGKKNFPAGSFSGGTIAHFYHLLLPCHYATVLASCSMRPYYKRDSNCGKQLMGVECFVCRSLLKIVK